LSIRNKRGGEKKKRLGISEYQEGGGMKKGQGTQRLTAHSREFGVEKGVRAVDGGGTGE
jgi:hypothetical protein